jgi:hypothetical protein
MIALAAPAAAATPAPTLTVPTLTAAPPLDPAAAAGDWAQAATVQLEHDLTRRGTSVEPTTVRVATDGRFLYVRFDAVQHAPVVATQHSNDVVTGGNAGNNGTIAWGNDDAVWVDLWPTGPGGFAYQFEANANGSHNEASSENAAFAPQWDSRGAVTPAGFTVTMAIPLAVLHGAHTGTWRAQFVRYARAGGAQDVWASGDGHTVPDSLAYAGAIAVEAATAPARSAPRVALYGLGSVAAPSAGGTTTHTGADVSVPVSATASVFATLHPDYSNVELDQQTIAPQVYQRVYNEVRPFFTQAASFYGTFNCAACVGYRTILYAPGIPTPSQGYAFEGRSGNFALATFDAIGAGRTDAAGALNYNSPDTTSNTSTSTRTIRATRARTSPTPRKRKCSKRAPVGEPRASPSGVRCNGSARSSRRSTVWLPIPASPATACSARASGSSVRRAHLPKPASVFSSTTTCSRGSGPLKAICS